jgi:hypothetical protein
MDIRRNGSQPSTKGPAEYFTGNVRIDPLFQAPDPARGTGGSVTFEPGARTAWHTHPLGQTLIVTSGLGWTQCWGGPIEEIRPGDEVKPYNIRTTVISPGAVATELPNSVTEPDIAERLRKFYEEIALPAKSFARAVAFAISQPEEVDVNEILFRPTRQEL